MADLTDYQRDILVRTILGEARGEGAKGMEAVAHVIRNRTRSGEYATDPSAVAKQANQFSVWNGGAEPTFDKSSDLYKQAERIVNGVFSGQIPDPTDSAIYYHTTSVNPTWASGVTTQYGTSQIGNHVFYPRRGEAPAPATPSLPLQSVRLAQGAQDPALAAALNAPALPRPRPPHSPAGNQALNAIDGAVSGLPVEQSAFGYAPPMAGGMIAGAIPELPRALPQIAPPHLVSRSMEALPSRRSTNLGDDLGMLPIPGGRQSPPLFDAAFDTRVGAMRMLPQTETVSSQGLGVGASLPPPPSPAMPSPQLAGERATDPVLQAALNARFPTRLPEIPQSGIGSPPATRTVTSVAMPPLAAPSVPAGPSNLQLARAEQSAARGNGAPMALALPASAPPQYAGPFAPQTQRAAPINVPGAPNGSYLTGKTQDRLVAPAGLDFATLPRSEPLAVASQLDVTSPRAMPQLPRPRPDLGMGGVDVLPVPTSPNPMPRLDRPGIFGTPQIFGRDIKLPGFLGGLQDFTKAMNNASGPFNNGADNLLYNRMRGGDFNTPGAATAQSGGYLYAPRQGGGYVNVGRANPSLSPAQTYESRNNRNEFQDDAANRVNGRGN